jgi:polynucleotide 5'-hydroxyl-kinase GRC3/NOL9
LCLLSQEAAIRAGKLPFTLPPLWRQLKDYLMRLIEGRSSQSDAKSIYKMMVFGEKGTGKSTFIRYFLNSLLNTYPKVIFIDLDPGQSEFSFPSSITLHTITTPILGPPFTHMNYEEKEGGPEMGAFLGTCSPGEVPKEYVLGVDSLANYLGNCQADNTPVLINTMGWITGTPRMS